MEHLTDILHRSIVQVWNGYWPTVWVSMAWALLASFLPAIRHPRILLGLSLVSIPLLLRASAPAWILLNLAAYLSAKCLIHLQGPPARRWSTACWLMGGLLIAYVLIRAVDSTKATVEAGGIRWPWAVFEMFFGLRWLTLLWETGAGKVRALDPARFVIWTSMPVTCFGPVLRYSQFETQWGRLTEPGRAVGPSGRAWWLQWTGIAAMLGGLALVESAHRILDDPACGLSRFRVLIQGLGLAPWGFLLTVWPQLRSQEILGQRLGLELPASFHRPFGRTNLSDFWANWNISVTVIFRDSFFYNRWGFKKANPYVNSIILFTLVGLWHASNLFWFSWGLVHGIGFAVFLWYRKHRDHFVPFTWRHWIPRRDLGSAALTYLFVASLWMLPPQLAKLLKHLF